MFKFAAVLLLIVQVTNGSLVDVAAKNALTTVVIAVTSAIDTGVDEINRTVSTTINELNKLGVATTNEASKFVENGKKSIKIAVDSASKLGIDPTSCTKNIPESLQTLLKTCEFDLQKCVNRFPDILILTSLAFGEHRSFNKKLNSLALDLQNCKSSFICLSSFAISCGNLASQIPGMVTLVTLNYSQKILQVNSQAVSCLTFNANTFVGDVTTVVNSTLECVSKLTPKPASNNVPNKVKNDDRKTDSKTDEDEVLED